MRDAPVRRCFDDVSTMFRNLPPLYFAPALICSGLRALYKFG